MIDIYCHILPGVDDGPTTIEESLEMAREAVREGIKTIIATPHHHNNKYENEKASIVQNMEIFNKRLQDENISLSILPRSTNIWRYSRRLPKWRNINSFSY